MARHTSTYDLNPGPEYPTVLTLQDNHRSEEVWHGPDPGVLDCRKSETGVLIEHMPLLPVPVQTILRRCGFYGLSRLGTIKLDWPFITALVERWRQETHTFHLPVGEASITLQDVAVLLGLPILGPAVTTNPESYADPAGLCSRCFGRTPDATAFRGSKLRLRWLDENFSFLDPNEGNDEIIRRYARAWILGNIGGQVCGSKAAGYVHLKYLPLLEDLDTTGSYSWGSAALAVLYREMCRASKIGVKQIGGLLILLQLWGYERLSHLRPERVDLYNFIEDVPNAVDRPPLGMRWAVKWRLGDTPTHVLPYYRDQLDRMRDDQMIWEPYTQEILNMLPAYCLRGSNIWLAMVPLVCFSIVEWHLPQRVLRQFGMVQFIPDSVDTNVKLHRCDGRGRHDNDWSVEHSPFIDFWNNAMDHIVTAVPSTGGPQCVTEYMPWYRRITRRMITRPTSELPAHGAEPSATLIEKLCQDIAKINNLAGSRIPFNDDTLEEIYNITQSSLRSTYRDHYMQQDQSFRSHGTMKNIPIPTTKPKRVRKERMRASQQEEGPSTQQVIPTPPRSPYQQVHMSPYQEFSSGHSQQIPPSQTGMQVIPTPPRSQYQQMHMSPYQEFSCRHSQQIPPSQVFPTLPSQGTFIPGFANPIMPPPPAAFIGGFGTPYMPNMQVPFTGMGDPQMGYFTSMLRSDPQMSFASFATPTNARIPPFALSPLNENTTRSADDDDEEDDIAANAPNNEEDGPSNRQIRRNPRRNIRKPGCGTH